jgi:opacity protein-like surface antigen
MKGIFAALALSALLPAAASAADLDYTYAEAAYSQANSEVGNGAHGFNGGQGVMLDGSYAFGAHWFTEAAFRYNDFHQHLGGTSVALAPQSFRLGGGFHAAMADSVDFTAHLDYVFARTSLTVDQPNSEVERNNTGYLAGIGLRIHPTDLLEMDLGLDHDKLGFQRQVLGAGCASHGCATALEFDQGSKETIVSAAARYNFGSFIGGAEYRRGNTQGWRELLLSLRIDF